MFKEDSTINVNSLEILAIQRNTKLVISFLCLPLFRSLFSTCASLDQNVYKKKTTYFSVISFQDNIQCITIEETLSENSLKIVQVVTFLVIT